MDAFYTDFNIITTASFLTFSCKSQPAFSIYTSPHHRSLVTQHHMIPWYNSAGHLIRIRNRKAVPGWISYSRMSAFYTKFSITPELIIQRNNSRISCIFLQIPSLPFSLLVFFLSQVSCTVQQCQRAGVRAGSCTPRLCRATMILALQF